jgi:methylmalonyl-CoA mutase
MTNKSDESLTDAETGPLFSDFPPHSYEAWRKATDKVLKGAPFEKKLVTKTYEGIDLQPLYRLEDTKDLPFVHSLPGFAPYLRGTVPAGHVVKPWEVCQELPYGTPNDFNKALRSDLVRGQTAVNLIPDEATRAGLDADQAAADKVGQGGVSLSSVDDLAHALEGVDLEQTPFFIQASASAVPLTALLMALLGQQGKALEKLRGCVGMDPLGELARTGTLPRPLPHAYEGMATLTRWASAHAPGVQTIAVQGHPYHDGGASVTQELAFALASGVEYLREMQTRELTVDVVAPRMRFAFSIGSHFFMEIARLRAARVLWARIVTAFGGNKHAQKMIIHGRTSAYDKTVYDPYVNMLRTTTEAFAGVVGGCDSLHVSPFDEVARPPDEFSRRIARNTHTILREECHLPRTVDPAGGSWYVENLTDAVARNAWALFQEVEKMGGMGQALQADFPQTQVAEVAAKRATNIARRKDVLVGVNRYANPREESLKAPGIDHQGLQKERAAQLVKYRTTFADAQKQTLLASLVQGGDDTLDLAIRAAANGATLGEIARVLRADDGPQPTIKPVCLHRVAQPFERLRQNMESYAARNGARPKVFLANMGPVSQHKARADFAGSFVEVGGFEVIGEQRFAEPQAAVQAALAAQTPVVVICSSDATYPDLVPPIVEGIKQSRPATKVLLAGYPTDHVEAFQAAGIDDFIHLGANCYQLLSNLQTQLGIVS